MKITGTPTRDQIVTWMHARCKTKFKHEVFAEARRLFPSMSIVDMIDAYFAVESRKGCDDVTKRMPRIDLNRVLEASRT